MKYTNDANVPVTNSRGLKLTFKITHAKKGVTKRIEVYKEK